jgi:putative transposase
VGAFHVSKQRACRLVRLGHSTFYWRSKAKDQGPLRTRLRELAAARPRFGYPRLHILLRREGWQVNIKRVYRLYKLEGLEVRYKKRRKGEPPPGGAAGADGRERALEHGLHAGHARTVSEVS